MDGYKVGRLTMLALPVIGVLTGIPLALRLVSRNQVYGIRTVRSLATDAAWYDINTRGGWALIIASLIALVFVFIIQKRMPNTPFSLLLQVGAFTICLAAGIGFSLTAHDKLSSPPLQFVIP